MGSSVSLGKRITISRVSDLASCGMRHESCTFQRQTINFITSKQTWKQAILYHFSVKKKKKPPSVLIRKRV
jgi:hypothetical protein